MKAEQSISFPATIHASFQGTAAAFQDSLANQPVLIITALAAVYIVLGILYESYIHPITILSTLPSAGVGALLALKITHNELNVIGLIGIILLIGLVKKNAIMMIDFALEAERKEGKSPVRCNLRSLRAAFPSHHDDDHGRVAGWLTAGSRYGNGFRTSPAAWSHYRRRIDRKSGTDPIHHSRGVSVYGPAASAFKPQEKPVVWASFTCQQPRGLEAIILKEIIPDCRAGMAGRRLPWLLARPKSAALPSG